MPGSTGVMRCDCAKRRIIESKMSHVPPRFRGCTLGNYVPSDDVQVQALGTIQANLGRSLLLWGSYGRGKTHLAVAQYRELVIAGQSVAWRSMSELMSEITAAVVRDEHSIVLDRVRYADSFHLFLDDIDKFKPTEFKSEALFDLFDTLYRRNLSVTVTTNLSLQTLIEEKVNPAIIRRLDDMCLAVRV